MVGPDIYKDTDLSILGQQIGIRRQKRMQITYENRYDGGCKVLHIVMNVIRLFLLLSGICNINISMLCFYDLFAMFIVDCSTGQDFDW